MRRFLKFFGWTCLSLALIALIAFNMLVVWVATGPRSLKEYVPAIEARFNASQPVVNVKVDDVALVWNGWRQPIDTRISGIRIYSKKNILVASFEQISATMDLLALTRGRLMPDSITLYSPVINLYRKLDGTFTADLGQDVFLGPELPRSTKPKTPIQPISDYLKVAGIEHLQYLSRVDVKDGTVNIGDTRRGILSTLDAANISFKRTLNHVDLTVTADIVRNQEKGSIYIQANVPMDSLAATGKITLDKFKPSWLAPLHEDLQDLQGANVPLSGWVNVTLDADGQLTGGSVKLNAGKGDIVSTRLDGVLPVDSALLEGKMSRQKVLLLDHIQLVSDGVAVGAHASIWQDAKKQWGIKLSGKTGKVPVERVRNFWPPWQSPESRDWVVSNLSKGYASSASLDVNIAPGQLAQEKLPDDAINAHINFDRMDVRYKPEHAIVSNAAGIVHVNANQLMVTIQKGDYLTASKLSNGKVFIGDLLADNPRIEVSVDVDAPAADIATFLAYPDLDLAESLGIGKGKLSGHAKGRVNVAFWYYAPRDKQGNIIEEALVDYTVDGEMRDAALQGFLGKYDISKAHGALKIDNTKLTFDGEGAVFGDALKAKVTHYFRPKDGVETKMNIDGSVSTDMLQKIGVDLTRYIRGAMPAVAEVSQAPSGDVSVKANVDLTSAEIQLRDINWRKANGTQAKANLELTTQGDAIDITALDYSMADAKVIGSMQIDKEKLRVFHASTFKLGNHDLAVEYAPIEGGFKLSAMGAKADLSPWFDEKKNKKEKESFSDIPALDLQLNIAEAMLDAKRVVKDLKGVMRCNPVICEHANITGNFEGGKPFAFTLEKNRGARTVKILSEDAGAFLKGLDVYDNMEGGKLEISGVFNDASASHPLTGKIFVWDFQLKNTPVLSRIVSLASFGGILDALSGKGLAFDKLKGDFTLQNDIITVKDLGTVGGSMGISADGTVDTKRDIIDLKGTAVPANTINSLLKNVPIVGEILTGGEGIIAAVYTVKGNVDDPEVSVNPLSVLAPGFLRKMFE